VAVVPAQVATLPIDTAKVRLQLLQRSHAAGGAGVAASSAPAVPRLGMVSMARKILAEEGFAALYKGFWPAIHRQLVFASLRIGLYREASAAR
jgi:solute carrier family 25 (mitochondrial uncoupling protein), member 8/9